MTRRRRPVRGTRHGSPPDAADRRWLRDPRAPPFCLPTPVRRWERPVHSPGTPVDLHAVLRVREPDGDIRVLVDPMALDPEGTTTLDAWSPSVEGDRLAYQLSTGGDEESRLFVLDVATGQNIDGPIDRCRYSPVGWLP